MTALLFHFHYSKVVFRIRDNLGKQGTDVHLCYSVIRKNELSGTATRDVILEPFLLDNS